MPKTSLAAHLGMPWEVRVATLLPVSAPVMGAVVFAALSGLYLLSRWLLGIPWWLPGEFEDFPLSGSGRISLILSAMIGYLIAMARYGAVAYRRDLRESRAVASDQDPGQTEREALLVPVEDLRRSRVAGWIGVGIGLSFVLWIHHLIDESFLDNLRSFSGACLISMTLLMSWIIGRAAYTTLGGRRAAELSRVEIDLVNLVRLRPLGRIALRGALTWIVGASILSLIFLTPDFSLEAIWAFVPLFAVIFAVAALSLVLPVRRVQREIRRTKYEELAQVNAELARVREGALGGGAASQARLAGLLAYRSHVQALPEWPFDASLRMRFFLYLLIPLASWFGGAFVERFVSAMMD